MRRLARWTLNGLTALSVTLLLVASSAYADGYRSFQREISAARMPGARKKTTGPRAFPVRYRAEDGSGTTILVSTMFLVARPVFAIALRRRKALRVLSGLCPGCWYDLRATPAKCPECGRAAAADAPAAGAV